jgi:hypothetical protein
LGLDPAWSRIAARLRHDAPLYALARAGTGADETPPAAVLSFVARQLDVPEAAWHDYGRREPTRRAHLTDLARRMGYRAFGRTDFHALATFAMPVAQTIIQPLQLAEIVIDEMRRRRLLLPPVTVIEAIVRRARRQADELVHDVLTQGLGDGGRTRLDALLARRGDRGATWLSWLRNPPLSPAPRNVMRLLERLDHVRAIGLARRGPLRSRPRPSTASPTRRCGSHRSIWRNCPTGAAMPSWRQPRCGFVRASPMRCWR